MLTQKEMALQMAKDRGVGFVSVTKLHDWKGYAVYSPEFADDDWEEHIIGLPYIILAKENELRWSTPEEIFEHRDAFPEDYEE